MRLYLLEMRKYLPYFFFNSFGSYGLSWLGLNFSWYVDWKEELDYRFGVHFKVNNKNNREYIINE